MAVDLDQLSREVDSPVRLALAALKANPATSPLPWAADDTTVRDDCRMGLAYWADPEDAAHIAAAVNAAPVLAAEVERLTALLAAARVAVEKLYTECRHDCACVNLLGRDCDCGAAIAIELRRAVGLEEGHG
jgi:hypothetical protein